MKVFFSIKARLTLWYALLMLVVTVLVLVALMWSVGQAALAYHEGCLLYTSHNPSRCRGTRAAGAPAKITCPFWGTVQAMHKRNMGAGQAPQAGCGKLLRAFHIFHRVLHRADRSHP